MLYVLLDCAHDDDLYVWLGNRALVRITALSEATIKRHLHELVERDLIKLVVQGNGAKQPTVYRANNGTAPSDALMWTPSRKELLRTVGVQIP